MDLYCLQNGPLKPESTYMVTAFGMIHHMPDASLMNGKQVGLGANGSNQKGELVGSRPDLYLNLIQICIVQVEISQKYI